MTPTFVLHTYMNGGVSLENEKNNGLYSLMSGLLTKGYDGKNYQELKTTLESMSAELNSFSGKNAYGLQLHGQSQHFSELLEFYLGALLRPDFPSDMLEHEREIILRGIKAQTEDPIKACFQEVSKIFFNEHPYRFPIAGTDDSVRSLERDALIQVHKEHLAESNILFTYCGDKDIDEVLEILEPAIGNLPSRKKFKRQNSPKVRPLTDQKVHVPFDREQTQILIGFPSKKLNDKSNIALKIITAFLSGQSSELFVDVRDRKGLCYATQPVHFTALEAGYWGIYLASGHDKVEAASEAICAIMDKIKKNGLSKKDFNRVKKMILGQSLLNVQTNEDYANIYSVTTLHHFDLDFYHLNNQQINDISHDDFQKAVKKLFGQKRSIVTVGRS